MLLVGLLDGCVEQVEVLRSVVSLPHELQTNKIIESTKGKANKQLHECTFIIQHCFFLMLYTCTCTGAVTSLSWSPEGSMFAVGFKLGSMQIYHGSGRDYSLIIETNEVQVCMHLIGIRHPLILIC